MTDVKVEASGDIATGTLLINFVPTYVLFYCGTSHSFIFKKLAKYLCMSPEWTYHPYRVATLGNRILVSHTKYPNCNVKLKDRKLEMDLVQINMSDFGVILGMHCLVRHFSCIDYEGKRVIHETT